MAIPSLDALPEIPDPMENLEMRDGETVELRIIRWVLGRTLIHPRDGREAHDIPCMRVWVPPESKPTIPAYWDLTSKHLIAALTGYLTPGQPARHLFRITARGNGPAKRYQLEAVPL